MFISAPGCKTFRDLLPRCPYPSTFHQSAATTIRDDFCGSRPLRSGGIPPVAEWHLSLCQVSMDFPSFISSPHSFLASVPSVAIPKTRIQKRARPEVAYPHSSPRTPCYFCSCTPLLCSSARSHAVMSGSHLHLRKRQRDNKYQSNHTKHSFPSPPPLPHINFAILLANAEIDTNLQNGSASLLALASYLLAIPFPSLHHSSRPPSSHPRRPAGRSTKLGAF